MRPVLFALLLLPQLAMAEDGKGWAYTGDNGPENWGTLSDEYETCTIGQAQSPIDLSNAEGTSELAMHYAAVPLSIVNNGHTLQVGGEQGGGYEEGGTRYDLLQGHFHTPSEHVIGGKSYPMELHLVHRSEAGGLGVIGVFIEAGAANDALNAIIDNAPAKAGDPVAVEDATFNAASLLPGEAVIHHYSGSLTTPPCSEDVAWHVFAAPITASAQQIRSLAEIMGENARPLQRVNDRLVVEPAD